jgi:hypothetical protein
MILEHCDKVDKDKRYFMANIMQKRSNKMETVKCTLEMAFASPVYRKH